MPGINVYLFDLCIQMNMQMWLIKATGPRQKKTEQGYREVEKKKEKEAETADCSSTSQEAIAWICRKVAPS